MAAMFRKKIDNLPENWPGQFSSYKTFCKFFEKIQKMAGLKVNKAAAILDFAIIVSFELFWELTWLNAIIRQING